MSFPQKLTEVFQFSETAATLADARAQVNAASDLGRGLFERAVAILEPLPLADRDRFKFWLQMALGELVVNLPYHDHMNFHGGERELFFESEKPLDEQQKARLLTEYLEPARGLSTSIDLIIEADSLTLRFELAREFPAFETKWDFVKNNPPNKETIEQSTGRGLMLASQFFDEASYEPKGKVVTYRKHFAFEE